LRVDIPSRSWGYAPERMIVTIYEDRLITKTILQVVVNVQRRDG
jgi:hypothetical protein